MMDNAPNSIAFLYLEEQMYVLTEYTNCIHGSLSDSDKRHT